MNIEKVSPYESKLIFHNSTSTIGKLLQSELLRDSNVIFAGYSCPHPLETRMIITVITSGKNPREVITNTFNNLVSKLDDLDRAIKSFKKSD
jgi:DNA-directed RNA polymerase subunit L